LCPIEEATNNMPSFFFHLSLDVRKSGCGLDLSLGYIVGC
jgi:hypothetical protein